MLSDQEALQIALDEAKAGFAEGGVPPRLTMAQIGAALVSADGTLMGKGRNQRVQLGSPIHHGETSTLYNTGRLSASAYKGSTMYTTLSPCDMCTGACILYGIKRVVIGENRTFLGGEAYLKQRGIDVVVLDNSECRELMEAFIAKSPELWNEDIGVEKRVYSKESSQPAS
ncbi:cytosine deaminase [Grosmannia clavigera kw1407]|uniref:Cytosine deaminase n=1 Tax=Grosmannia clavigera (strain kw1407 / UAMH 11150) TaxID=655863 RepID=F0XS35_GROCL|nr:cytosine deaminase [Grosmannia clavigera kw1407]EFW99589.1 cytosine deaminase [Grosmannia clavigera kw1407]